MNQEWLLRGRQRFAHLGGSVFPNKPSYRMPGERLANCCAVFRCNPLEGVAHASLPAYNSVYFFAEP